MDKQTYKQMVGELLDEKGQLNEKLLAKEEYIKLLEKKIDKLETDIYFLTRNNKMDEVMKERDEEIRMKEIGDSLTQMGMTEDDITELSDMLDELIEKKEDKDAGNEK